MSAPYAGDVSHCQISGVGRGAIGFTTRSDIGPARPMGADAAKRPPPGAPDRPKEAVLPLATSPPPADQTLCFRTTLKQILMSSVATAKICLEEEHTTRMMKRSQSTQHGGEEGKGEEGEGGTVGGPSSLLG